MLHLARAEEIEVERSPVIADLAPMLDPPGGARFVFPNAPKPFEAYPGMPFGYTWFDGWPPTPDT